MVGVMPNIITVGFTTGDVDRDKALCRRWRTAESRAGCKDAHDDERVGKSRMYMRRGLEVTVKLPVSSLGGCTLMHISKKFLALTMLPFDGTFPDIRDARCGTTS
jgi:hypothetical protein